jgi:hypothetical protein
MLIFSAIALVQAVSSAERNAPTCPSVSPSRRAETRASSLNLFNYFLSSASQHNSADNPLNDPSTEWGDSITTDPDDLHRIYFQNVDGLRNNADEIDLYISSMAQFQVDTFCWADPGLDFSQHSIRMVIKRQALLYFSKARCAFSSSSSLPPSKHLSSSGYQPGGTLMATTGKWATRSTGTPLVDPSGMGRWSGLSYLGKHGKRLSIVMAYRSPRQQPKGGFDFYDQQYATLLSRGVKNPNVRKHFVTDITHIINALQDDGHEILLSLDANETLGLACPKNEEGRTGDAQTDANTTDRQNQNRQTQAEQTDTIGSNKTQTEVRQGDNNRIETDKRRHRQNEQRTTKITIRSCRRRRIN